MRLKVVQLFALPDDAADVDATEDNWFDNLVDLSNQTKITEVMQSIGAPNTDGSSKRNGLKAILAKVRDDKLWT